MRLIINGKSYHLRNDVKTSLQGIISLGLGVLCYKVNADDAAVFMWLVGAAMLFGKVDSKR